MGKVPPSTPSEARIRFEVGVVNLKCPRDSTSIASRSVVVSGRACVLAPEDDLSRYTQQCSDTGHRS